MKINYNMVGTKLTGGSRVILEIANKLVERGHEVTITTMGTARDTSWFPLKAKINYIGMSSTASLLFRKIIRKMNLLALKTDIDPWVLSDNIAYKIPECDINVATYWLTAFSVHRSSKGTPFYHMQSYEPFFYDLYKSDFYTRVVEESYYLPSNKIANSLWLKEQLKIKHNVQNTELVYPALDHNIFYPRNFNRNKGKKRIVSLGKNHAWKGFREVLEAVKIVMKKRKDVELVVFGADELGIKDPEVPYTFVKHPVNNGLAELYAGGDIAVSGSYFESFPLPPLEAMACGLPVVTTRYGTEDYAVDGVNSIVVEPKDPVKMAEAILRILDDEGLSKKLSDEGIRTAKRFTWDNSADKVEALFKEKLKRK